MTLRGAYKVSSNMESGHGRNDIMLESLGKSHSHMIIEFKQAEKEKLSEAAKEVLQQMLDKEYYAPLSGEVICIGLAHNVKFCEMEYKIANN